MKLGPRFFLFGLCLSLIGASPGREKVSSVGSESPAAANKATPALAVEQDGRLSLQAAGRRFEFGQGELAISAQDSFWAYRFQGSRGGIRALSISSRPEQTALGSLEYRHPEGIVERYLVQNRGVEQQFVLPGPYAGGDVLLTGSVATDLVVNQASSFGGISFRCGEETVLFYGEAKASDAGGKTALLEERWADGELTIVVPASFLASARFPVTVDPYIGDKIDLVSSGNNGYPAVATTGSSIAQRRALAVWSSVVTTKGNTRIVGRIIDPRGDSIQDVSAIDEGDPYYYPARVAWSLADNVWAVAAAGQVQFPPGTYIQVNRVDLSGNKTTGGSLNVVAAAQNDVDIACNNVGRCLITWVMDQDSNGTLDSVKGIFYTPASNTFGSIFSIVDGSGGLVRRHSRVASNGADFYEVNTGGDSIEGYSVSSVGVVVKANPSLETDNAADPDVSYNSALNKYLVAWDVQNGIVVATTMSGATPPVASGSAVIMDFAVNPQVESQQYMGWSMVISEPGGFHPAVSLVKPNLVFANRVFLDAIGVVPRADVAHFDRGLTIVVYQDNRGDSRGSDVNAIAAQEFRVPAGEYADFNNNGYASAFVWRPGIDAYFYFNNDLDTAPTAGVKFGTTGDIPVRTDYFGSGLPDLAVFRPSNGYWYIDTDRNGTVDVSTQFGLAGDIPVPGDYDGDGRTELAVFRPSEGNWYIRFSSTVTTIVHFGTGGDVPVPADYNGDFVTDLAVWRPSTGMWYVDTHRNGTIDISARFGSAGDIPVPGDYGPSNGSTAPDGLADFAVFRPSNGNWYVDRNHDGVTDVAVHFGTSGDVPVGGIYDANPNVNSPFAVFRPSIGTWYVDTNNDGTVDLTKQFGTSGDIPMQQPCGQYRN